MAKTISQTCCRLLLNRMNLYDFLHKLACEVTWDYIFGINKGVRFDGICSPISFCGTLKANRGWKKC